MNCPYCGAQNPDLAQRCGYCGRPFSAETQQMPPAQSQPPQYPQYPAYTAGEPPAQAQVQQQPPGYAPPAGAPKKNNTLIIILAVVVVAVVIIAAMAILMLGGPGAATTITIKDWDWDPFILTAIFTVTLENTGSSMSSATVLCKVILTDGTECTTTEAVTLGPGIEDTRIITVNIPFTKTAYLVGATATCTLV